MAGFVVNGQEIALAGRGTLNYLSYAELALKSGDMRLRGPSPIQVVCWHNTKNIETTLRPGVGPRTNLGERIAKLWSTDERAAGAHGSVDHDGSSFCHADLVRHATYHAGPLNGISVGFEMYEDGKGIIYEEQLKTSVALTLACCELFGIQLQMPDPLDDLPIQRVVVGGQTAVGVFGHCHQYGGKQQDPGRHIFKALADTGRFKTFDFRKGEDRVFWKKLQEKLGLRPATGIPGPKTRDALQAAGFAHGLYVWGTPL